MVKSKTQKLVELFVKWENALKSHQTHFIRDGIINEDLYDAVDRKILFIAKESNATNEYSWDYCDFFKEYKEFRYPFLYRIAEWSYGILNNFPTYDSLWKNPVELHNHISKIAFMNVKKSAGGGLSFQREINLTIQRDFELIHRQIEIISPDIIITGLSWPGTLNLLFPDMQWNPTGYNINYAEFNGAKVIDFYHPSSRNAPAAIYSLLQNIFFSNNFIKFQNP